MKKLLLFILVLLSFGVYSQNKDATVQDILNFKDCYIEHKSHGLQEKSIDIEGEIFNVMSERDYAR